MYESAGYGSLYSNDVFIAGVNQFVQAAISKGQLSTDNKMWCSCSKCKNRQFIYIRMLEEHLYKYGFTPDYYNWTLHGEELASTTYINDNTDIPGPSTYHNFEMFTMLEMISMRKKATISMKKKGILH
ncbi:unnamed protein product [Rhodiola kirilowii]